MATCKTTLSALLVLTALVCAPVRGEDPIPGTSELGKLESGSVESTFNIPAPPVFVPGAPPPPNNDRQKSQIAAKALALAGAAQGKIACMQMMSEAMKEENKKNSGMMMAMAMQMCAQADQNMAAAMKNDEGRKQISQNDIPKMAEIKTTPAQLGKDKIKEAEIPSITFNDNATKGSSSSDNEIPVPAPINTDLGSQVFNKPSTTDDLKDPLTNFTKDPSEGTTMTSLDAIDRNPASEEPKPGAASNLTNTNALGGGVGGAIAALPAKGAPSDRGAADVDPPTTEHKDRKIGLITSGEGGGESGGSAEKSGSSFDMAALMEQMMGGAPAEGGGPGLEVITMSSTEPEEPPPNLFEYASYRYQKLVTEKGAIKRRKGQGLRTASRGPVAAASKIWTDGDQKLDTAEPPTE